MQRYVIILLAILQSVRLCDSNSKRFTNTTARIVNIEAQDDKVKREIGGNVKIIDGCRFRISNMTIIPTGPGVYWYGIPSTQPTEDEPELHSRVVLQALGSYNGQTIDFVLVPGYNFDDFAVMLIYSEGEQRSYGAFGVVGKVKDYLKISQEEDANLKLDSTNPFAVASTIGYAHFGIVFSISASYLFF